MAQGLEGEQMDQVIRAALNMDRMMIGKMMATIREISMLAIGKTYVPNMTLLSAMVTSTAIQTTRAPRSFF